MWAGADIYVQPSREEPFGLGVLEAMLAGTPVVASRVGGLAEQIEHGRTGLLVEPDDAAALAGAIGQLATNRKLAAALANAGCRTARARFSREAMVNGLESAYARCMRR
jgi:glycosyltransferase involved in cell wall biosynthesis